MPVALTARTQGAVTTSVQGVATASIGAGRRDGDDKARRRRQGKGEGVLD